jgi:hypothetical protein
LVHSVRDWWSEIVKDLGSHVKHAKVHGTSTENEGKTVELDLLEGQMRETIELERAGAGPATLSEIHTGLIEAYKVRLSEIRLQFTEREKSSEQ